MPPSASLSRRILPVSASLLLLLLSPGTGLTQATTPPAEVPAVGRVYHCVPGPWGDLEYSRIVIEPPDEFLAADYHAAPARWNFPGHDNAQLEQLWQEAGLDAAQLAVLRTAAHRETSATGMVINPPEELVRGLDAKARAVIYNTLARLPGNLLQSEPFRFRAEMADEWFADSGVDAATVAAVRRFTYRRGNALLFSDPGLVLPGLPTAADRVRLIKTLARKSTLLVKLRLRPDTAIDPLTDYWSTGLRRKDVRPLLQSLARHPGGMTLDIVHLLPRLPRGLLYTYPDPGTPRSQAPDCHWTAMNFFLETPDERFGDILYLKSVLTREYGEVKGPPQLGDVLIFSRADGEVVHSCTYIAADLVFTKNGQSPSVPWTLTTVSDLQAFYPHDPPLGVRAFRRRE